MNDKTVKFQNKLNARYNNEYLVLGEYINQDTKIKVKHKKCNNEFYINPKNFLSSRSKGCNICRINDRTKKDYDLKNEVYKLVGNEYSVLSKYEKSNIKIKIKHNICNHIYEVTPAHFLSGRRCPKCYGNNKLTEQQWINEVLNISNGEYKVLEKYINNRTPIKMQHVVCGHIWKISPSNFKKGHRCPVCALKNISLKLSLNEVEVKERIKKIVGNEYEIIDSYKNSSTKIKFIHHKCNKTYYCTLNSFLSGSRCPYCKKGSKGEEVIKNFLIANNINFKKEYWFKDLLGKKNKPLRYDFCILNEIGEIELLIEYDGRQHFIYEESSFISYNEYLELINNDKRKNKYCLDNNIQLIRIKYSYYKELDNILKLIVLEKDSETIRKFLVKNE